MWASAVSRAPRLALLQHHKQRSLCSYAVAPATPAYDWEILATPRLEDGGQFFVAEERIRSFEVGPNQQSDIVAIANMMQARFHACFLAPFMHATLPGCRVFEGQEWSCYVLCVRGGACTPRDPGKRGYECTAFFLSLRSWCISHAVRTSAPSHEATSTATDLSPVLQPRPSSPSCCTFKPAFQQ